MPLFRRLLLLRLHQKERLSESFMHNLLTWVHPGFSLYAGPPADVAEIASMESQARYITRPVFAMDALCRLDDGSLVLQTPPDPRTGATPIELVPLEWIHRITSHLHDPGPHCQRFYGADSNRCRIRIVSFIADPCVIDRILRHLKSPRSMVRDPFEPRAPPVAVADFLQ
jgi:hypothetical protein